MFSLILLGGVFATTAYAAKVIRDDGRMRRNKESIHEIEKDGTRIDVVDNFEDIIAMCHIKRKDGVLPKEGWKTCDDFILVNFTNSIEEDLHIFNRHYYEVRQQELNKQREAISSEYGDTARIVKEYRRYLTDGSRWEVSHWWGLSRKEHEDRIGKLYEDTIWNQLVTGQGKVIPDPVNPACLLEIWNIRHIPNDNANKYSKQHDFAIFEVLTSKGIKNIYNLCCQEVGLTSGFKYNKRNGLPFKERVSKKTDEIQDEARWIIDTQGYECYCGHHTAPGKEVCPKCRRNIYVQCQHDLSWEFAREQMLKKLRE